MLVLLIYAIGCACLGLGWSVANLAHIQPNCALDTFKVRLTVLICLKSSYAPAILVPSQQSYVLLVVPARVQVHEMVTLLQLVIPSVEKG